MFLLLVFLLLFSFPAEAQEITGNIEIGEKFFDLIQGEEDTYTYHRGYVRYGADLNPQSCYSLRYELQKRNYIERVRFSSLMQEIRASLTWQNSDFWRTYYYLNLRARNYPEAKTNTYVSFIPEFQVNFYPSNRTTYTGRFRYQYRNYPHALEKNFHQSTITLSFRHRLRTNFTINGRFRAAWEIPSRGNSREFEHRASIGFRYVID